jgi:HSP20 family protein
MSMMRRSNPFGEILSLRQAMDRLFEESFIRPRSVFTGDTETGFGVPIDVSSTPDSLVIEAALPGVKPEDVDVTVLGDTLTITANSAEEREGDESGYLYREVRRGRFSRTVTLPSQVDSDKAAASFENGMLRLSIPKAEQAKPRQIRLGGASDAKSVGPGSTQQSAGSTQGTGGSQSAMGGTQSIATGGTQVERTPVGAGSDGQGNA